MVRRVNTRDIRDLTQSFRLADRVIEFSGAQTALNFKSEETGFRRKDAIPRRVQNRRQHGFAVNDHISFRRLHTVGINYFPGPYLEWCRQDMGKKVPCHDLADSPAEPHV